MARKKDFRPDTYRQDYLGKLLLTKKQRQTVLRWFLYSLMCLIALLVQDVIMSRVTIFGTTTELVPCFILAVCILQGAESGCFFALIGSLLYYFSGSAPGVWIVATLTILAVMAAIFRQAYLQKGFFTLLVCLTMSMLLYELINYGIGVFLNYTRANRVGAFIGTALLSVVIMPLCYPILMSIGRIGGETWNE